MGLDKDVLMTLSARDEDLMRKLEQQERKYDKLKAQLTELGKKGREATKETADGFEGLANKMVGAATGILSVAAAFGLLKKGLQDARDEADAAGRRITDQASAREALLSLAKSDSHYNAMLSTTDRIRQNRGIPFERAAGIVYSAEASGQGADAEFYSKLQDVGMDPQAGIRTAKVLRDAFGGAAGVGTSRQLMEKLIVASDATPATPGDFAASVPTAAAAYGRLGKFGGDEELLAVMSRFTETFKSADAAAEKIQSLANSVATKAALGQIRFAPGEKLEGLELLEGLPRLAAEGKLRNLAGKKRLGVEEFLGDSSSITAHAILMRDKDIIGQRLKDIVAAERDADTSRSMIAIKESIRSKDPMLTTVKMASQASESQQQTAEERFGTLAKTADAYRDELTKWMRRRGDSELYIQLGRLGTWSSRLAEGDEAFLRRVSKLDNTSGGYNPLADFPQDLRDAIKKIGESADKLNNAAANLNSATMKPAGPTLSQPNSETGRPPVR